jgi:PTH1 family peptidyl-tRNA hydrolase
MPDGERWLVVGLGNPGPTYAATRHNAGFFVVDLLADRIGGAFRSHKSRCDALEGRLADQSVILAKPRSYMNESGGPVVGAARFFKVDVENLIVVHDELDLPYGTVRVKRGGGEGGHNGLRSISASIGSKDYIRVRFGVGRPPGRQDAADFVLKPFNSEERKSLELEIDRAADAVEAILREGLLTAQNVFNTAP